MLKLKKIFLLLGVSLALCSNQCYQTSRPSCEKGCEGSTKYSFPSCVNTCLKKHCAARYDNARSSSIGGHANRGACQACLSNQSEGVCQDRCQNTEDPYLCREKCSKLNCENQCSLLKNYSQEANPTKQDCGKCKKAVKPRCSKRCGKKTRPGHTACVVACVHESCLTTCYPN